MGREAPGKRRGQRLMQTHKHPIRAMRSTHFRCSYSRSIFMSISRSPYFTKNGRRAAALSFSPNAGKHPACGRKKAALPLILFRALAVLFLFCGTLPASAQEGQCSDDTAWELIDGTLFISGDFFIEDRSCGWRDHPFSSVVINEICEYARLGPINRR